MQNIHFSAVKIIEML